jgi:hypothetical protein
MPTTNHYRATWFALLKEVEKQRGSRLTPEERHDVQVAHAGKASLTTWGPEDYDRAIAAMQRSLGQHRDWRAHVKEEGPAPDPGGSATAAQCRWIEDLCDRCWWKRGREKGPVLYAGRTVLRGNSQAAGRDHLLAAYRRAQTRTEREGAWRRLTRRQASDFIKALRKLSQVNPAEVR